jgi:hypothetical protein
MRWHRARNRNKLSPAGVALVTLFAIHTCVIAAVNLDLLQLTRTGEGVWIYGICVPMILSWLVVVIEVLTWPY